MLLWLPAPKPILKQHLLALPTQEPSFRPSLTMASAITNINPHSPSTQRGIQTILLQEILVGPATAPQEPQTTQTSLRMMVLCILFLVRSRSRELRIPYKAWTQTWIFPMTLPFARLPLAIYPLAFVAPLVKMVGFQGTVSLQTSRGWSTPASTTIATAARLNPTIRRTSMPS
jgi:hypothetical protein